VAQSYAQSVDSYVKDLTCGCDRAKAAAVALAEAISKAGGCNCDAGKALATAYSQAQGDLAQAAALSQALFEAPAAQKCLKA
jgi:hypothetical protein